MNIINSKYQGIRNIDCLSSRKISLAVSLILLTFNNNIYAEANRASVTWDTDFLVGKGNGYTNGLYDSWHNMHNVNYEQADIKPWLLPFYMEHAKNSYRIDY